MDFIIDNWFIIVAIIAVAAFGVTVAYKFITQPNSKQVKRIKEWLLYAVVLAEQNLGSKTGEIKLRNVYDMFIVRFPVASKLIPFDVFSKLVDEALDKMEELLKDNEAIKNVVKK